MAFPTTSVLDDFNTGASQALTARAAWSSSITRASGTMSTDSVPTYATGVAGSVLGNATNTVFNADQEAWATFNTAPGAGGFQIEARYDAAAGNGYALVYTGGVLEIVQLNGFSGGSQIGSNFSVTPAGGDSLGMQLIGTSITGWYKTAAGAWTQVISGTDSLHNTTGRLTILTFGSPSAQCDAYGGGNYSPITAHNLTLLGVGT